MTQERTIVYIAGYGRSGSTLLDRILSCHPEVFGAGEIAGLLRLLDNPTARCACAEAVGECTVWSGFLDRVQSEWGEERATLERGQSRVESWKRLTSCRHGATERTYRSFLQEYWRLLFESLPGSIRMIVDSSKTARRHAFRPIALAQLGEFEVKVLHLVRDPKACMTSMLKGSNRKMERGVDPNVRFAAERVAANWPLANFAAHAFERRLPSDYLRVRYEDLVNSPRAALTEIGRFLGLDLSQQVDDIEKGVPLARGHQIAGNRLRCVDQLVVSAESSTTSPLRQRHRLLCRLFCGLLMHRYGY